MKLYKAMEDAHETIKRTRNTICGHVKHAAVQKALEDMEDSRWGFLDLARKLGASHYKFAAEIAVEILVSGVPEDKKLNVVRGQFERVANLLPVFKLTDHILSMYVANRKLI
jgi:hypothetical protein